MNGSLTTYIALLRAVNVGGKRKVAMADLRGMLGELGFGDSRSLLQSGNLVFRYAGRDTGHIETRLEAATLERLGLKTTHFVRSAAEWDEAVTSNPFPQAAVDDPAHLVMMALRDSPPPEAVERLRTAIAGREVVEVIGRQAYLVYPDGIGTSKLTLNIIESKLGTRGTARNWNTVLKLQALTAELNV